MIEPSRADDGAPDAADDTDDTAEAVGTWLAEIRPLDYARLARPFDVTFSDMRGGVSLEYITGEQAISRLNEELGPDGWDFEITEHGIHPEADECWVLGKLTCRIIRPDVNLPGELTVQQVVKQQFGSQKLKRSRSSGTPLDIGFDLKGAATDSLKKCASLVGVALYLWKKEGGHPRDQDDDDAPAQPAKRSAQRPKPSPPRALVAPPNPASPESLAAFGVAKTEAVKAGFAATWLSAKTEQWTQPQVDGYRRQLDAYLAKVRARAS